MKKLRVGVWLNEIYSAEEGGKFSYYNQLISGIAGYQFKDAEIIFISNRRELSHNSLEVYSIKWLPCKESTRTRIINFLSRKFRLQKQLNKISTQITLHQKELKDELNQVVDVIYYPVPMCAYPDFPFIYTLWDLGHLSTYAFPELSMNKNFEERKADHDYYPHKALMIFAESSAGKKEIIKYLGINDTRIKVVPLFPSAIVTDYVSSHKPQSLTQDLFFIHYPAQYWAHKNHYNLLQAFSQVLENFPTLNLVLTGSDKGNKEYIMQQVTELGLKTKVIELGFVSDEELKWLYLNSSGLVMPTFLGPTNMPLLEAAALNCPVACSRFEGHVEQLGEYGYYFDPKNPDEITAAICSMINDKLKGSVRNYKSIFNIDNTLHSIDSAFTEIKQIRFCWGSNDQIF